MSNDEARTAEVWSVLRDEIKTTSAQISDFLRTTDQMLVVSVAVLAALGTYASKLDATASRTVLLFVPLIVSAISGYAMRAIATIVMLGAYRGRLEQILSDQLSVKNIFWESAVTPRLRKSSAHIFAEIAFSLIVVVAFATGSWSAITLRLGAAGVHRQVNTAVLLGILFIYAVLGAGLVVVRLLPLRTDLTDLSLASTTGDGAS